MLYVMEIIFNSNSNVKYLDAVLDQSLSDDLMASSLLHKANARLKFLYRKSKFLTFQTRELLVSSLIHCHFDYTCVFFVV